MLGRVFPWRPTENATSPACTEGAVRGTQQHWNTPRDICHLSPYQVSTTSDKKRLFVQWVYLERLNHADLCLHEGVGSEGEV